MNYDEHVGKVVTTPVEILAAEPTRAQIAAGPGTWPHAVRFLASPSNKTVGARLLVASLKELEQQNRPRDLIDQLRRMRQRHAGASLVLLAPGEAGKSTMVSTVLLQGLAAMGR